jgi:3-oxoacyl-(acyl-carrier-protein) synthase
LGNLLAGSPAADIILGMHMIEKGIIPAVIQDRTERLHHDIEDVGLVTGESLRKTIRRIMVNCQSYEGQSASLIIEAVA